MTSVGLTVSTPGGSTSAAVQLAVPTNRMIIGANTPGVQHFPASRASREFYGDVAFAALTPHAGMELWAPSTKRSDVAGFAAGKYDADLSALSAKCAAAKIKTKPALWHEWDVKTNGGNLPPGVTWAQYVAAQAHGIAFFANDPWVTWTVIVGAHLLVSDDNAGHGPDAYSLPGLKSFGVDFDGSRPTALPYVDYGPHTARLAALKTAHGYDIWVPEFGAPKVPSDDGTARAAWFNKTVTGLKNVGVSCICLFDTAPEGPLTDAPSVAAWNAILAA